MDLDRDEESRLADRQPDRPGRAKNQADAFHKQQQTVEQSSPGNPADVLRCEALNLLAEVGEEFVLRIEIDPSQEPFELRPQVFVHETVNTEGDADQHQSLSQLDGDDGIKAGDALPRRRRFLSTLRHKFGPVFEVEARLLQSQISSGRHWKAVGREQMAKAQFSNITNQRSIRHRKRWSGTRSGASSAAAGSWRVCVCFGAGPVELSLNFELSQRDASRCFLASDGSVA